MAIDTMRKKFEEAKRVHRDALQKLGSGFQKEIVTALAALIPEGWHLHWQHSDQQYNDEDYYWDIGYAYLVTDLKPRQGKLLKEKKETVYEDAKSPYASYGYGSSQRVKEYGHPAEYQWLLDGECEPRSKKSMRNGDYYEDEGAIAIKRGEDNSKMKFGLKRADIKELEDLFKSLTQDDLTLAFGSEAVVTVRRDGTCEAV